ncbi:hypothetical protein [Tritonibacter scottomollicae]|uniref:hypothetical protein n=1 Tax=Tritonibacter scottomollicae TaxID=483013 RepID=UPI001056FB81|nr:hypothetical protein [Tritonibacter scottomollicae]
MQFGVENAATIAIGSGADWEKAFDRLSTVFQAYAKITGRLRIEAKVGVDTWLFDGSVEASGSIGTGWHFGGRITENVGSQNTETLYWFEGLRVQGNYAVRAGAVETDRGTDSFETGSATSVAQTITTAAVDNRTVLLSGRFDESFFVAEGGPNDWQEA